MLKSTRHTWWSAAVVSALSIGGLYGCSSQSDSGEDTSDPSQAQRIQGQLKRVVITDPEHGVSRFDYFLELAGERWLPLQLDAEPDFEPNQQVIASGQRTASAFHAVTLELVAPDSAADTGGEELGSAQQPLIAATPKRVAVVLFNFSNDASQPINATQAKDLVFSGTASTNAYYKEISYGVRSLVGVRDATGDVFGWYTIDAVNTNCVYQDWGTAARAKALAAGVDLSTYDHVIHYFPRAASCQFSGVGQLPGKYNWINASGSQTIAHELGHNFGVHHASSYRCVNGGVGVTIGGTCTANEYGDPFDVMGSRYRHVNAYQKEKLGFLEAVNIQTVTATGSFALAPLEQKATGLQVLRFPIPGTSDVYYVEYRQPFGFDSFASTDPVANGVLIHRITIPTRGVLQTKLLDNAPATTSFTDAALLVGKTFTDAAANVSFTLTARTATSASVQVTLNGTPPDPMPTTCAADEFELDGHCYFLLTTAQTNSAAKTACTSRGAGWNLASLESAAENSFVSSLVGATEHWLSGSDVTTEGTFVWANGTTFWTGGLSGAAPAGVYANFVSGEPNDSGDCLRIVSGGQWRDVSCTATYRAVCEK
jgi:hypothetical protein